MKPSIAMIIRLAIGMVFMLIVYVVAFREHFWHALFFTVAVWVVLMCVPRFVSRRTARSRPGSPERPS